ncbi:hypothetical protein EDB85DRAFT_1900785 [Lactarius pseudohatsudake]|nr:hypothetical protein EDB85DRAFT_1900785 [Lactarius pseudohatsudake]
MATGLSVAVHPNLANSSFTPTTPTIAITDDDNYDHQHSNTRAGDSDLHQRRQAHRHQLRPGYQLQRPSTTTVSSSTTPTATTPTPTTLTTRQWPRQDLRRPQQPRRHDDHRKPATLDWHQREQLRKHQRLRPTTDDHLHSNINSRNDSDDTTTTATTTRATQHVDDKQHFDNRDDDRDDGEDSGSATTMAMVTQTEAHAAVDILQ